MNKCSNCGKEFEGNFCPYCGTKFEQRKRCPNCGTERLPEANFCAQCGYNFASETSSDDMPQQDVVQNDLTQQPEPYTSSEIATSIPESTPASAPTSSPSIEPASAPAAQSKFVFNLDWRKLLKWLPVAFFGLWAVLLWAFFASNVMKGDGFLFESLNLYGLLKDETASDLHPVANALLAFAVISDVYIALLLFVELRGTSRNKLFAHCASFALHAVVIICAAVLGAQFKKWSEVDDMGGNFVAVVVSLTVVFALLQGAALFADRHFNKSQQQAEDAERKPFTLIPLLKAFAAKIKGWIASHRAWSAAIVCLLVVAILLSVILPVTVGNKFRIGKVQQINIGDSRERVTKILGKPQPSTSGEYVYCYYSSNAERKLKQLQKINDKLENTADLEKAESLSDQAEKLRDELKQMDYKYIEVTFDHDGLVRGVTMNLHSTRAMDDYKYKNYLGGHITIEPMEQQKYTYEFFINKDLTDANGLLGPIDVRVIYPNGNYELVSVSDYTMARLYRTSRRSGTVYYSRYEDGEFAGYEIGFSLDSVSEHTFTANIYLETERELQETQQRQSKWQQTLSIIPYVLLLCGFVVLCLCCVVKLPKKYSVIAIVGIMTLLLLVGINGIYSISRYASANGYIEHTLGVFSLYTDIAIAVVAFLLVLTTAIVSTVLWRKKSFGELGEQIDNKYGLQMSKTGIAYVCTQVLLLAIVDTFVIAVLHFIVAMCAIMLVLATDKSRNGKNLLRIGCATVLLYVMFSVSSIMLPEWGLEWWLLIPQSVFFIVYVVLTSLDLHRKRKQLKKEGTLSDILKKQVRFEVIFLILCVLNLLFLLMEFIYFESRLQNVIAVLPVIFNKLICSAIEIGAVVTVLVWFVKKHSSTRAGKVKAICIVTLFSVVVLISLAYTGVSCYSTIASGLENSRLDWYYSEAYIKYWNFSSICEKIIMYVSFAVALLVFCAMVEVLVAAIVKRKKREKEGGTFTLEMAMCDLLFAVLIMLCLLSEASVPSLLA